MYRACLVLAFSIGFTWADDALACGGWSMESTDKRLSVRVNWESIAVRRDGARRPLVLDLEQKNGHVRGAKNVATIEGGSVRRGDVEIGRLTGENLVLGDRSYVIDIADAPAPNDSVLRWVVTVKQGDIVLMSGRAMSLLSSCGWGKAQPQYARAIEDEDIRKRVALALVATTARE